MSEDDLLCRDVIERLPDYLDGELQPEIRDAVAAHLRSCARCRASARFQGELVETLHRTRSPAAPGELRRRIVEALLDEDRRQEGEGGDASPPQ